MAIPQAEVKTDIYMIPPKVPNDFNIPDLPNFTDRVTNTYKLDKKLYNLKDAGRTWNYHLKAGLLKRGWVQSPIDEYRFTKKSLIIILCVDDACIISPHKPYIIREIESLSKITISPMKVHSMITLALVSIDQTCSSKYWPYPH